MILHESCGIDIFHTLSPYWSSLSLMARGRTRLAAYREWDQNGEVSRSKDGPTDRGSEWLRQLKDPE